MKLWSWLIRLLGTGALLPRALQNFRITISRQCLEEIRACIQTDMIRRHEGVCYLLGRIDGFSTRADAAIRPDAITTPGSFHVDSLAMATVMRRAAQRQLQVVGQLHTHPGAAYHSEGDERGARIRYKGYVSIVLPDYGRHLPKLNGVAAFIYQPDAGFLPVPVQNVRIVQDGWYA
jgi:proteasome lid subunit RPN8/RPN11